MLKAITWGQFFALSASLLALYYLVVGFVYYRKELKDLIKGKRLAVTTSRGQVAVASSDPDHQEPSDDYFSHTDSQRQAYDQVNALTDDLGDLFNAGVAEGWERGQILDLIKRKLADHHNLGGTGFETSINNYIAIQADKSGLARVSAEELRGLWKNG